MDTREFGFSHRDEKEILGEKVNLFCAVSPEEFDPQRDVQLAQELVTTIVPRIGYSSKINYAKKGSLKLVEEGGISILLPQDQSWRLKGYAIGDYDIAKYRQLRPSRDNLEFEYYEQVDPDSGAENPKTRIIYMKDTLRVVSIAKVVNPSLSLDTFEFNRGKKIIVWKT